MIGYDINMKKTIERYYTHDLNRSNDYNQYSIGYADGYSKAENDYHKKTEEDRKNAFDFGKEVALSSLKNNICQIIFEGEHNTNLGKQITIDRIKDAVDYYYWLRL